MLLHEFATNAAKYGALSTAEGTITIECREEGDQFVLLWIENGGPAITQSRMEGFGTLLAQATVKSQLSGEITRLWMPHGLTIRLSVAKDRLNPQGNPQAAVRPDPCTIFSAQRQAATISLGRQQ